MGAQMIQKKTKYRNVKTEVDGILFDSKREAKRWTELCLMQKAGQIEALERQVKFTLLPPVKFSDELRRTPATQYVADFSYTQGGLRVVEDVKGAITKEYRLKRKMMLALLGIEVQEIGRAKKRSQKAKPQGAGNSVRPLPKTDL